MYETHFGLKKRPFRALAHGSDVFIGPQAASTLAAIKKGLSSADAIVAVTGPVGGGKTTLVGRALQGVGEYRVAIPVGRIKLGHDEVLELLLQELGIDPLPAGTVQRFTLFRRLLKNFADKDTRVIVVVEDASRVGADALSELEALTSADAGVSDGAGIVLMGDGAMDTLLVSPQLARLKQRLRLRHVVQPLDANELRAYFTHCFRLAGGDFDTLFQAGSAELLHALTGGIPRMANNVVESAMTAAAEASANTVSAEAIRRIAADEFGLQADMPATGEPDADDAIPELIQDTLPDLEVLAPHLAEQPAPEPPPPAAAAPSGPPTVRIAEPAARPRPREPKPAATQEKPAPTAPAAARKPAPAATVGADGIPTLTHAAGQASGDLPDWERDPTLAELRPDLEALEHAMAIARGAEEDDQADTAAEAAAPAAKPAEPVPEIILDRQIQAKIEEAEEAIKRTAAEAAAKAQADAEAAKTIDLAATGEMKALELPKVAPAAKPAGKWAEDKPAADKPAKQSPPPAKQPAAAPAETEPAPEPATQRVEPAPQADPELDKIAQGLSRARTLDDVDDKMAETLFGEEFSAVAAEVAARARLAEPANDDIELALDDEDEAAAPVPEFNGAAAVRTQRERKPAMPPPPLDEAASKRLATVRALNGAPNVAPRPPASAESIVLTQNAANSEPPAPATQIDSIESQFGESMTQTLEALSSRPRPPRAAFDDDDDDDDDDHRGGFLSRFRRH